MINIIEDNAIHTYDCLMLDTPFNKWNTLQNIINSNDIKIVENTGFEEESHITILYGLEQANIFKLKKIINKYINIVNYEITGVSTFESKDYDVLKFTINSPNLIFLNKLIRDNFKYTSSFPKYTPHMTIAYLQPGKSKRYITKFNKQYKFKSNKFIYSYANTFNKIRWET